MKREVIGLMISVPNTIQTQLGEAISVIADSDFWESTSRAERHDDELSYASAFGKHGALGRNVRPSRQRLGSVGPKAVGVQQHAQG